MIEKTLFKPLMRNLHRKRERDMSVTSVSIHTVGVCLEEMYDKMVFTLIPLNLLR